MPTPLPAVVPQDYGQTLNAYRTGMQDRIAQDERNLLKEAGGLAASGNMKGAQAALYRGGNFGEARNISQEQRAQSAEARAAASHARTMKDADLERASKTYELFGRLIPTIGDDPQKLEQAKALIKQRTGQDFSSVTMDQLPLLYQQNIDIKTQLDNEMKERHFRAEQERAKLAQSNVDRSFNFQAEEAKRNQANTDRTFGLSREQFDETKGQNVAQRMAAEARDRLAREEFSYRQQNDLAGRDIQREGLDIQRQRNKIVAAKAGAPKPLTEGQAKAQSFHNVMADAQEVLKGEKLMVGGKEVFKKGVLPDDASPSPMNTVSNYLATNSPDSAITSAQLNKRQKQYVQAAMQWVRAKLRKESGATISPEEFSADYRVFFPQPGDDAQTRKNKARARRKVEEGLRIEGAMGGRPGGTPDGNNLGDLSDDDLLRQLNE